ncbi:hypothetical protein UlMin_000798 [Ulmus minor]
MASSSVTKLACLVLLVMVVAAPVAQGAIACGTVTGYLLPCLNYLKGAAPLPAGCCSGVKTLNNVARSTPDRQSACNCLKQAATTIKGINTGLAGGLPGKCGVNIPFKISPQTNCNK